MGKMLKSSPTYPSLLPKPDTHNPSLTSRTSLMATILTLHIFRIVLWLCALCNVSDPYPAISKKTGRCTYSGFVEGVIHIYMATIPRLRRLIFLALKECQ